MMQKIYQKINKEVLNWTLKEERISWWVSATAADTVWITTGYLAFRIPAALLQVKLGERDEIVHNRKPLFEYLDHPVTDGDEKFLMSIPKAKDRSGASVYLYSDDVIIDEKLLKVFDQSSILATYDKYKGTFAVIDPDVGLIGVVMGRLVNRNG